MSNLSAVDLSPFTPQELIILLQRLTVVAEALQTEIEAISPCFPHPRYITFQHLARLVRWQRYLAYLIRAVSLILLRDEKPTFYISSLPLEQNGLRSFLELLRRERSRSEMNAYSIRANVFYEPALRGLIESGQAQAIDIEARFYSYLLNNLSIYNEGTRRVSL